MTSKVVKNLIIEGWPWRIVRYQDSKGFFYTAEAKNNQGTYDDLGDEFDSQEEAIEYANQEAKSRLFDAWLTKVSGGRL